MDSLKTDGNNVTHGKPAQTDFEALGDADPEEVRCLAASLASRSDHPVSHAIAVAAEAAVIPVREVTDFSALADRGVTGRIGDHVFCLENPRLMTENGFTEPNPSSRIITLERQGNSVVLLTDDTPYDEQTNKSDASYLSFILT